MISSEIASIDSIVIHKVGNKGTEDGVQISKAPVKTDDSIDQLLLTYFFGPFKNSEYYNLFHETDINMNEVYSYINAVFEDPDQLYVQSVNIAKHLYNQSLHPKVKMGELYVVYLQDCIVDGETVDAIGLFKSESKETFLKVYPKDEGFEINSEDGINISKLDKGCFIFNTEPENGYLVAVSDNMLKGSDARYWKDDFLQLTSRTDEYYHTKNVIDMCKSYVTEQLPKDFDINRVDQADMLNKSAKFFKEKESFGMGDFADEVMQQPEVAESFKNFRSKYEEDKEVPLEDEFKISKPAVKKSNSVFKSVIKLDKNFHIYVHGNRELIQRGFDENMQRHYYQLFFDDEA